MKRELAVAMTLLTVGVLVGFTAVPVQAVPAECSTDFSIPDSEPANPRSLAGGANETGSIDVASTEDDKTVRVELKTNSDILDFGIFELAGTSCELSDNVSPAVCKQEVRLDTTDVFEDPPVAQECTLDSPGSGTATYHFVFENQQMDGLQYAAWEV